MGNLNGIFNTNENPMPREEKSSEKVTIFDISVEALAHFNWAKLILNIFWS